MAWASLAIAPFIFGQAANPEQTVDRIVAEFMASEQVPGVAIAFVANGETIFKKGYGVTDLQTKAKMTPDTPCPIASLSKPFVAMGILKLVEEGKIDLHDPLGKYLPDVPLDWKDIPLVHLLDHTSGIPDHINSGKFHPKPDEVLSPDAVYDQVTSMPLKFEAGLKYEYSNGNYVLLARIIEKVAKQPYADFLKSIIFAPLGMADTFAISPEAISKLPKGYAVGNGGPTKMPPLNPTWVFGNGQLASTISDLAKWDASLYSDRILNSDTLRFITTDQGLTSGKPVGYAMGWVLTKDHGSPVITHDGRFQGYRSYFARFAAYNLSVIILANNDTCNLGRLGRQLINVLVPNVGISQLVPIPDEYPELTAHHLAFLRAIVAGDLDPNWLTPAMQKDFLPSKYEATSNYFKTGGDFTGFDPLMRQQTGPDQFVSKYRLQQGRNQWVITLKFDRTGAIFYFTYAAN